MQLDILIAGFGGQGVMSLGKIIAAAAMREGRQVSWFPSYGAEMRGGTAHCYVKISDSPIASPLADYPDIAVILNQPSFDKFKKKITKANPVILNTDLVRSAASFNNKQCVRVPLNTAALDCGDSKVVNSIVLGILMALKQLFREQTVISVLKETFPVRHIQEVNLKGFYYGKKIS